MKTKEVTSENLFVLLDDEEVKLWQYADSNGIPLGHKRNVFWSLLEAWLYLRTCPTGCGEDRTIARMSGTAHLVDETYWMIKEGVTPQRYWERPVLNECLDEMRIMLHGIVMREAVKHRGLANFLITNPNIDFPDIKKWEGEKRADEYKPSLLHAYRYLTPKMWDHSPLESLKRSISELRRLRVCIRPLVEKFCNDEFFEASCIFDPKFYTEDTLTLIKFS